MKTRLTRRKQRSWLLCGVVGTLVSGSPARAGAADLTEIVPPEALYYVGWWGREALRPGTPAAQAGARVGELLTFLGGVAGEASEERAEVFRQLGELAAIVYDSAAAVTLLDLGMGEGGPDVQAGVVVRAGDRAAELGALVTDLLGKAGIARAPDAVVEGTSLATGRLAALPMPLCWGVHRGHVLLTAGQEAARKLIDGINRGGPGLAANAEMQVCRKAVAGTNDRPVCCIYADVPGLVAKGKVLAQALRGGEPLPPMVEAILEEAGINGIRSKYAQVSMDGQVLRLAAYAHAPRPRKGILQLWEQKPLEEADAAFVPADAYWMQACNWDLSETYRHLQEALDRIDAGLWPRVDKAMNRARGLLGIHPFEDFFNCLGDTWVCYDAPSHGGILLTGAVLVAEVRDADRLQRSLGTLIKRLDAMAGEKVTITAKPVTCGGREMSEVVVSGVPFPLAPSWSVIDGRWVLGLFPQTVAAAMDQIDPQSRKSKLWDDAEFKRTRGRLPPGAQAIGYCDNRHFTRALYPFGLLFYQAMAAMAARAGLELDIAAMPTLAEQLAATPNSVGVTVADDDGILYARLGPPAAPLAMAAAAGTATSILLPSLQRARVLSKRTVSAANLRGIGQACMLYADAHGQAWPPDLQTLLDGGYVYSARQLQSPFDAPGNVSYVYIAGQSKNDAPQNVLAYEKPELNDYEGTNVLFLDGHVEFMKMERFSEALRQTYRRLGRESQMPSFDR